MKVFFVFSGQGAQAVGMGKDVYDTCAVAKAVFDRADQICGYPLSKIIFEGPAEDLTRTKYCQPAIYTASCAFLAAFREKFPQVQPLCCGGLSLGEYAALYAADAFSFDDGLKLLCRRAEYMESACAAVSGSMATILGGDTAVIEEVCRQIDLDVANYNSPGQVVISGPVDKIQAAVAELKARGMRKVIELKVAGAFHSRLMKSAGDALAADLAAAEIKLPSVPVYHNFTAEAAGSAEEIRSLLRSQVAGSVRWEMCLRRAVATGADTVIEFGPGNVLTGLARRTIPELKLFNINSVESLENFAI